MDAQTSAEMLRICSPVDGEVEALSSCSDTLFAKGMLGPGFVVFPKSGEVHAPVTGTVKLINANAHGFGITTESGTNILIHLGTNTGGLHDINGRHPFSAYVRIGDQVCTGQLIAGMKNSMIRAAGRSDEVIVIASEADQDALELIYSGPAIAGQVIAELSISN